MIEDGQLVFPNAPANKALDELRAICAGLCGQLAERDERITALRTALDETGAGLRELGVTELPQLRADLTGVMVENMRLRVTCSGLVNYRQRVGPLGFQLEKADDYLREIAQALGEVIA